LGYTEFAGLEIKVKEGVLIPRPETEQLYALAADTLEDICNADPSKSVTVLDMCTGSGCLAYAFASDFPQAQVYGCDKSTEALNIACKQRLKCIKPIFFYADVLDVPPAGLPQFDIIVSNPPYVKESEREFMRENVLKYEPEQALFVPNENPLLFYRAIADWCKLLLKPGGHLFLEINEALGEETAALYENSEIFVDFNDKPRFIHYRA
jgi:release factor glutamine methyltransferase